MLHTINSIKIKSMLDSSDKNPKRFGNHKKAVTHFEIANNHGKALKRALITQQNKWQSSEFQLELVYPFCD